MAYEEAFAYLKNKGYGDRVQTFTVSSATVELAAIAVGTEPARIAKSLTFMVEEQPVMIICAGDAKINNSNTSVGIHNTFAIRNHYFLLFFSQFIQIFCVNTRPAS